MNIVDIIEKDDVTLSVRVELPEGRCALLNIHRPSLKDVHQRQPVRGAETRAAIVHDAVSSNVFCSDLIHATTAWKNSDYIKEPLLSHKGQKALTEYNYQHVWSRTKHVIANANDGKSSEQKTLVM